MLPKFYKIISLEKKKILYEIEASNTASLHRIFYSLEEMTVDFCGVADTPADSRGWGCVTHTHHNTIYSINYTLAAQTVRGLSQTVQTGSINFHTLVLSFGIDQTAVQGLKPTESSTKHLNKR